MKNIYMELLQDAVVRWRGVDSILRSFDRHQKSLTRLHDTQRRMAARKLRVSERLANRANDHHKEADRAARVAERLGDLTK